MSQLNEKLIKLTNFYILIVMKTLRELNFFFFFYFLCTQRYTSEPLTFGGTSSSVGRASLSTFTLTWSHGTSLAVLCCESWHPSAVLLAVKYSFPVDIPDLPGVVFVGPRRPHREANHSQAVWPPALFEVYPQRQLGTRPVPYQIFHARSSPLVSLLA